MSRFTNLVCILSLAACEHAAPSQSPPVFPEQPAPIAAEPAPAPAPVAEPAPMEAAAPEPAPTPAPALAPIAPKPKLFKKKNCNPMSRAACRWVEDDDERERPRVKKIESAQ
jgi:hypothetical protein